MASTTAIVAAGAPASAAPDGPRPSLVRPPSLQTDKQAAKPSAASRPSTVQDRYIVTLKDTKASSAKVKSTAEALTEEHGGKVRQLYGHALRGFSAQLSAAQAKKLAASPEVASVEPVRMLHTTGTQTNPPSWGLDRLDQTGPVLDQTYTYPSTSASGVTAYVIDTGLNLTHTDFGGRATSGYDFVDGDDDATDTCDGHGTHVAGTIGGTRYGVAKDVNLVGVRVLGCDGYGSTEQVVAGIDWVTANAEKPAVVNMSLGQDCDPVLQYPAGATQPFFDPNAPCNDGIDPVVDAAVSRSIAAGLTYVLSAGNQDVKACYVSPAHVAEAITVGATDNLDFRGYFSNHGSCVDVYAPGVNITSDFIGGDAATETLTGTSMAAPHVTGAAALVLAEHPDWTPQQVRDAIVKNAVAGGVHDTAPVVYLDPEQNAPNRLLHVGGAAVSRSSVGIQAYANGRYVTAENGGANPLIARSTSVGGWEQFDVVAQSGGFVALRSKANGRYVTAENGGANPLIARSTSVGGWEKFTIVDNADGSIAFKANANGRYVTADSGGGKALIARSTSIGGWEKFNFLAKNPTVAIRAKANGRYVTAENGGANPLIARSTSVGGWEKFDYVDQGDGWFGLRAQANGRYVTAESAGSKALIARGTSIGAWEWLLNWDYNPDGSRFIVANANGRAVTAESGGANPLIASRQVVCQSGNCSWPYGLGSWESFYFVAV
ncbi:S8 family serine peptidase [Plantactinospora sp. KBS50]|uniref:S8 family serine peptidase n=1 Tax=Plantactinospora sp. KBS50 TaxID=2024580 RepID=UPI0018DFEA95|nr:S8 family serine peptidase [Plantactinospora sp. KBS50]